MAGFDPSFQKPEQRGKPRRAMDRAANDLLSTFSTLHCRTCLERMNDGAVLLDHEARILYLTPQAEQDLKSRGLPFAISAKFTPPPPQSTLPDSTLLLTAMLRKTARSAC